MNTKDIQHDTQRFRADQARRLAEYDSRYWFCALMWALAGAGIGVFFTLILMH
jgi:hypothetical protein